MNELIFQDAVSELTEYYPCLMDESLVGEFYSVIKFDGNVKDQLEKLCRKYEKQYPQVNHE